MANKKFYYKNKKKSAPRIAKNCDAPLTQYSQEQLSLTIVELNLSETTRALFEKNRVLTAGDLVKRTEKDMYKIQGLNKKILLEVKGALSINGMSLREDAQEKPVEANKAQSAPESQNDQASADSSKRTKFGLVDRKQPKDAQQQPQKTAKAQKPIVQSKQTRNDETLQEELRKVFKGGKWGYMLGNKIVIPTVYDEIFSFKEGLASVEIDEKCGFIDENNNVVIPLEYETAMSFSGGLAMVVKDGKCGYINKNNEVVIPFEYDAGTPFDNGEAKIKKDGKWGTLSLDNKVVWI